MMLSFTDTLKNGELQILEGYSEKAESVSFMMRCNEGEDLLYLPFGFPYHKVLGQPMKQAQFLVYSYMALKLSGLGIKYTDLSVYPTEPSERTLKIQCKIEGEDFIYERNL